MSEALDLLLSLRLEDGRTWGSAATAVQRADAEAILVENSVERFHFVTRARGYSKTTDLAGIAVAVLLTQAPPVSKSYAIGADQAQSRLLLDSVEGFVRRTPGLGALLDVQAWRVTNRGSGASLEALAADASGAWGLRPFFAVCDEVAEWAETRGPKRIFEAVTSAIPKTGGRLAVITTSGSPSHWAKKTRDHAERDRRWRLSETAGPPPWISTELLEEQRARLLPSSFARLFENRWTSPEDSLVTEDDLAACVVLDGPLPPEAGKTYVIGLDVGIVNDATVAVVAHAEPMTKTLADGQVTSGARVLVDRVQTWQGSRAKPVQLAEVGEWIRFTAREYGGATIVFDPFQAVELTQRLERAGVRTRKFDFTAASVGRLALALFQAVRNRALALPNDDALLDELRRARLRETSPGSYRIDHDPDAHDDRVIALALCVQHLVERGGRRRIVSSHVARGRIPTTIIGRRPAAFIR